MCVHIVAMVVQPYVYTSLKFLMAILCLWIVAVVAQPKHATEVLTEMDFGNSLKLVTAWKFINFKQIYIFCKVKFGYECCITAELKK